MSAGIKRLQAIEVLLALDYEEARRSRDMKLAKACREEWLAIFEQLRKAERLKKGLVLIPKVKLSKLHSKIRIMLDMLSDRLTHRIVGLKAAAIQSELYQEVNERYASQLVFWGEVQHDGQD